MTGFIHSSSEVQSKNIGEGTNIWQYCVVLDGAEIGKNCNICSHCFIENNVKIGNNVTIKSGVQLWNGVTIEDNAFIGANVTFTNDRYPKTKNKDFKLEVVIIKKGASIGAGSVILPGAIIGENAMVGAGSVVTKDVKPGTTVMGNPAREKKIKIVKRKINSFTKIFTRFYEKTMFSIKKKEPTIIIMVDGGLGSQLNKYLAGQFLKAKTKATIKYDLSWFSTLGKSVDNKHNRLFDLTNTFKNLEFPIATEEEIAFFKENFYYKNKKAYKYCKKLLCKKPPFYLDGYITHWKYMKEIEALGLNKLEFNLNLSGENQKIFEDINSHECSVGVHIRRGDFVKSIHDVLTEEYFINAINKMKTLTSPQKPKFFIFSNGMDWVKEKILMRLPENTDICLVECNDNDSGAYDFYLLTNCKHQIISNASFGLFGAFLNKNTDKKVIAPQAWFKKERKPEEIDKKSSKAFYFPGWVIMTNEGDIING